MRLDAVYGGSFDPIHVGHVSMIRRAVDLGYRVIVVPAFRHAFGKQSAAFEHRVAMCRLALEDTGLAPCRVGDVERALAARRRPACLYVRRPAAFQEPPATAGVAPDRSGHRR